ncbi:hypothetical protein [Paenarthrobacter sp. A20]|uniref:hypothetical protein n=1 Tax=Paenarthrobacter sp. A20 TaxID=2817891 RepID=UPI00209FEAC4|nr:hypothetical protein [Paenarthrobacter sp. A20]MCP1411245.1 hypothetical protein [Paenarthrobacter sp. A20]
MNERAIPILPCRYLDDIVPFYEALGFKVTFRQARPNPYVCFNRGGIDLHFFGLEAFEPENSMGTAILLVEDTGVLFDEFATGLRAAFGKLPIAGIPRITRPRRKQGTTAGFTVVDPGGNWLRISALGETEDDGSGSESRLERVLMSATRQGDSHGDEARAISVIEAGLLRHGEATDAEKLPLLVYLAELHHRTGDPGLAASVLDSVDALTLTSGEREALAAELANAAELRASL